MSSTMFLNLRKAFDCDLQCDGLVMVLIVICLDLTKLDWTGLISS